MKKLLLTTLTILTIGVNTVHAGERMAKDTTDKSELARQCYIGDYKEIKSCVVINGKIYPMNYELPVYYDVYTNEKVPTNETIYSSETIIDKYSNIKDKDTIIKGNESFKYSFLIYFPYDNSNTHNTTYQFELENPLVIAE